MTTYVETVEHEYGSDYVGADLGYYATCGDCGWEGAVCYLQETAEVDARHHRCGMRIVVRRAVVTLMLLFAVWVSSGFWPFHLAFPAA